MLSPSPSVNALVLPLDALPGAAAALVGLPVPAVPAGLAPGGAVAAEPPPAFEAPAPAVLPVVAALKAARSTVASLVASAFFRWTTQMLPVVADPCGGR